MAIIKHQTSNIYNIKLFVKGTSIFNFWKGESFVVVESYWLHIDTESKQSVFEIWPLSNF